MPGIDASRAIEEAKSESSERLNNAVDALQWFLDREGELYSRYEAASLISGELDIEVEEAHHAIRQLTGDIVDPVQQVPVNGDNKVGVIEYKVWKNSGAYGYLQFHDMHGDRKRVVCAKCAEVKSTDSQVSHATEGQGTSSVGESWQNLLNKVTAHYANEHEEPPEQIEPGASLLSGTTINSNLSWHNGNDGLGSGLDADVIQGVDSRFGWYHEVVGGTVASGDAGPVWGTTLEDGESIQVTQAMLTTANLGAAPVGVDLVIADITNDVSEVTLITGDGTVKDDETGSPLGSYQNNSGAEEQIGILMDNGNWNGGSGSNQDLLGSFIARVV